MLEYDATPAAALLGSDAPPLDGFGAGASYRRFTKMRAANNGGFMVVLARVRDTVSPRGKVGILRCAP